MPQVQHFDDFQLTVDDARRFLSIAGASHAFVRHDVLHPLQNLMNSSRILDRHLAEMRTEDILTMGRTMSNSAQEISRCIQHLVQTARSDFKWEFTTSLAGMAQTVMADLAECTINICESSPLRLRVLFPSNALYSVVYELSRNASVHAAASPITLEWSMQSDAVLVSVHDAGAALHSLLSEKRLALELIEPSLFKHNGGLAIIRRIAHSSGGLLLARRSPILGGAEVSVQFPISSFAFDEKSE